MRYHIAAAVIAGVTLPGLAAAQELTLNASGYFAQQGLNVMVFNDVYPEGHQTGVSIIQHNSRIAANGDLRLEASPGQWSPVPLAGKRDVDTGKRTITQALSYPDPAKNGVGFNPVFYPKLKLSYRVHVTALEGNAFRIRVDLDEPLPTQWVGKVGFNLELFPGELFGKSFIMGGETGIFPRQPNGPMELSRGPTVETPVSAQLNGPVTSLNDEPLAAPLARGSTLVVAPDSDLQRLRIESRTGELQLLDGRSNHNNGWFIVRGVVAAGATTGAIEWVVTPNVVKGWKSEPVIQVSQLGYAPAQPKHAVIELDATETSVEPVRLYRLSAEGRTEVMMRSPAVWGKFLRYNYRTLDFSEVKAPGMYVVGYGDKLSHPFKIGTDVYARHAWQPTLEYFLPAQMCHMRVNEKYRVWHGHDHLDDALMAPVNLNHYDGYLQGSSTLSKFKPGEIVPGLDAGGWHDAGDFDMRVESQIGTIWLLSKMIEEFGLDYDATTIDQGRKIVEIHQPDGRNDALQQIEHGLLSVMGGYRAMGRVYRGIIDPTHRQYVMLGDAANQTDNVFNKPVEGLGMTNAGKPIAADDRWVFTEENPNRELYVAAGLAAASRVVRPANDALATETLAAARALYDAAIVKSTDVPSQVFALSELIASSGDRALIAKLVGMEAQITAKLPETGWMLATILKRIPDAGFKRRLASSVATYQAKVTADALTDSPYGVPYKPDIWGAGWQIQERGVRQYFFHKGWPAVTSTDSYINALNFVLGVHPGPNTISFASGVGANSATVAYGTNRADWSYIPGGVISGTALIRPDLPELKTWPFFWQQTEYVMGGGETNYMFLALAADALYGKGAARR